MRINHNISALNTYRQLGINNGNSARSLEKLSAGLRINRAGDDAAGLAISEKMRGQIRGLDQASRNSQDAISLIQTAEGALNETHSILQRMRELAVQSSNDTNQESDRTEIQKEINQLTSEINRIGNTTEFNTKKLLNGERANTLVTIRGNFGTASGATTARVTGLTGVCGVDLTGSGLTAGSHTLAITKTAESRAVAATSGGTGISGVTLNGNYSGATGSKTLTITKTSEKVADVTVTAANAVFGGNLSSSEITFSGDKVKLTDTKLCSGDLKFTFKVNSSGNGTVTIQASGDSGFINDKVTISGGKLNYNQFGIKFNLSGITDSGTMTINTSGAVAGDTFGTKLVGYSGTNAGKNKWMIGDIAVGKAQSGTYSGKTYLPDTNMTWAIFLSGDEGANGFRISGKGADGTTINDYVATDTSAAKVSYSGYGLKFTISGACGKDGDAISFTTKPTYSWKATFSGQTVKIACGASGGATISASGLSVGSINFSSSNIKVGSATFDITAAMAKQNYTYKAKLDTGSAVKIASGTASGTAINKTDFSGITGLKFDITNLTAADSGTFTVITSRTSGTDLSLTFQIGANQNQSLMLDIGDMRATALGVAAASTSTGFESGKGVTNGTDNVDNFYALDVKTVSGAGRAITTIDNAIARVSSERSKLGAVQNRLEHTINNLGTSSENLTASESRIRDVDMAKEMMEYQKNNILMQAAQSMLAQANQQPQNVLQLLR